MTFGNPPLTVQNETSEFSCKETPPHWFPSIRFGPNTPPQTVLAAPRRSTPQPSPPAPVPLTVFVMVMFPKLLNTDRSTYTPAFVLLLISIGPPQASRFRKELSETLIPRFPL